MGNKYYTFISHSSDDKETVEFIVNALEQSKIKCWVSTRDIKPGYYPKQIVNAIRECSIFVVISSEHSNASEHVSNEIERAFDCGKMIIPFMLNNVRLSDEQLYFLARQQQINAYDNFEKGLDILTNTIITYIENMKQTEEPSVENKVEETPVNKILPPIPPDIKKYYENGFSSSLLNYIETDEMLCHFHERLIFECDNVAKVTELAKDTDIFILEEIVNDLSNARDIAILSKFDSDFHRQLFYITKDEKFFEWWRNNSKGLNLFVDNFWKSIGYGTETHRGLIRIHNQIFQAIKDKNKDNAIIAMQDHFAILLFQLLGTMYFPQGNT